MKKWIRKYWKNQIRNRKKTYNDDPISLDKKRETKKERTTIMYATQDYAEITKLWGFNITLLSNNIQC